MISTEPTDANKVEQTFGLSGDQGSLTIRTEKGDQENTERLP